MPFLEEQPLHDLARGLEGQPRREALTQTIQTILPMLHCPSKREAKLSVVTGPATNGVTVRMANKTDYATCVGDAPFSDWGNFPRSVQAAKNYKFTTHPGHNGVCYQISKVRIGQISDGTSKTYLVGEKALDPLRYENGNDWGDNEFLLGGYNRDFHRTVALPPARDQPGVRQHFQFGSVHVSGWHMAFADGAIKPLSYSIDHLTHRRFGIRNDGQAFNENGGG